VPASNCVDKHEWLGRVRKLLFAGYSFYNDSQSVNWTEAVSVLSKQQISYSSQPDTLIHAV
jgi:hypothetical protein